MLRQLLGDSAESEGRIQAAGMRQQAQCIRESKGGLYSVRVMHYLVGTVALVGVEMCRCVGEEVECIKRRAKYEANKRA